MLAVLKKTHRTEYYNFSASLSFDPVKRDVAALKSLNQITKCICLRRSFVELVISGASAEIDVLDYAFSFQDFKMLHGVNIVNSN